MARWVGITVSGSKVILVDAEVNSTGSIVINADWTWSLQKGDRPQAYYVIHQQLVDYLSDNNVDQVIVKASAVSQRGMSKAHLDAAELRGVVIAAAAFGSTISVIAKGHISKTFGSRKVDEYLSDDIFWSGKVTGEKLRIGSREAALLLLAARK